MITKEKSRPYWHVDLKWICGLVSILLLSVLLFAIGMYQLTSRDNGPLFVERLVTSAFTKADSDVQVDIEKLKAQTKSLYEKGPDGVAAGMTGDIRERQKIAKQLQVLKLFTEKSHNQIGLIATGLVAVCLILITGLIYFSAGLGRLVSPGIVLTLTALPACLLLLTIQTGDPQNGFSIGSIGPSVLRLMAKSFTPAYLVALIFGALLLISALVARLLRRKQPIYRA